MEQVNNKMMSVAEEVPEKHEINSKWCEIVKKRELTRTLEKREKTDPTFNIICCTFLKINYLNKIQNDP